MRQFKLFLKEKILLCLFLAIQYPIISCKSQFITKRDRVRIDGDELPGIGGTPEHPDTCIAWYDKRKKAVIWRYKDTLVVNVAKSNSCVPVEEPIQDIPLRKKFN